MGGVVDADEVDHDRHDDGEDDPVSHAEQDAHELEEPRPFDERQRHEAERLDEDGEFLQQHLVDDFEVEHEASEDASDEGGRRQVEGRCQVADVWLDVVYVVRLSDS